MADRPTDHGTAIPPHPKKNDNTAHGLVFQQAEVTDSRLLAGIPEAAYMRFHLYTITKPDASEAVPRE